jgi:hypothetical protein
MNASRLIAVTALAALGLAACNNPNGRGGMASAAGSGGGICTPFATAAATTATPAPGLPSAAVIAPADGSAAVDDCLHRWGYALASSADPAEQVAQATLAACVSSLSRWNQQELAPGGGAQEAPSVLTGEQTTPIAEHYTFAQGRALFYVVQARAGKCAPPPMTNGTPAAGR